MKVVVVGAGGYAGSHILNVLLSSKNFAVSVASRQTSKSTFPSHVVVQKTDYTEPSLVEIFKGKDAVVSALGGGLGEQKKIVDAAEKAGVKRFLSSEYGCNTRNEEILQLAPVWRRKRDMIRYLGERAGENVDFSWTALVTGLFFDGGLKNGFLGFNTSSKTATIFDSGDTAFSTTNLNTVGEAVVSILDTNLRQPISTYTSTRSRQRRTKSGARLKNSLIEHVLERLRAADNGMRS